MTDDTPNAASDFILYQTENGRTRTECHLEGETLWLMQAQIAELFQTTPQNITLQHEGSLRGRRARRGGNL